ncbi:MAG: SPOR domain-containing protein, partial [Trueperaceae bacterium]|nr:SPOR domain-containing protein [Trueperaceae bacterium]
PTPATPTPVAPLPTPPPATSEGAPAAAAPVPAPSAPVVAPPPVGSAPSASGDPEAPYRVSVGAYGSAENAERQADIFRAAGYPVFTGSQGLHTIVLVGPYDTESAAEQVVGRIRAEGFGIDPIIYRFRSDASAAGASTPAPAPAITSTPSPAATPVVQESNAPATATSQGRFLQVGAFGTVENSLPLRQRLAGLGFVATERREDGLVKLLVGPFEGEALASARQRLADQGIESFVR